jgi:hypothetical protein
VVTLKISGDRQWKRLAEVEALVGRERLYRKGTDQEFFVDFAERSRASMALKSLNLIPGVWAQILGG